MKFAFATCAVIEIDGKSAVISPGAGAVDALDPADGRQIWRVTYEGYSNVPKPVFAHGLVFITTSYDTPDMLAIDPRGASGDVTDTHVKWTSGKKAPMTVSPIVVGDYYYTLLDRGFLTCHDARTGKEIYGSRRISAESSGFSASPWSYNGLIFALSEDGDTFVIQAGPEFKLLGKNALDEMSMATPAVANGSLILRTANTLYRLEEAGTNRARP